VNHAQLSNRRGLRCPEMRMRAAGAFDRIAALAKL